MGLFKKEVKKETTNEFPSLPELPQIPAFPKKDIQPLPNFPKTSAGLEAIKNNVMDFETPERRTMEVSSVPPMPTMPVAQNIVRQKEPIYIKLDKFQDSVKSFEIIKAKAGDIEATLKKIKEIKDREDSELAEWESELQTMKARMESIDNAFFNKFGNE